jgi:hypothetical protein
VWNCLQRLLAERVRKIGGTTVRSIGQIAKLQTIKDNDESYVTPREMLRELMEDNKHVATAMQRVNSTRGPGNFRYDAGEPDQEEAGNANLNLDDRVGFATDRAGGRRSTEVRYCPQLQARCCRHRRPLR